MRVEIISVGDELLIGQTINTNASWMGEQLLNAGIHVDWVTTVGDVAERLRQALEIAEKRADVVLISGGLGPTHDDITKNVMSDYFGAKLVMNEEILAAVKERFRKRGVVMAKINEEQALVPDNAEVMFNPLGTAPGLIFRRQDKAFFVMPGVPREMQVMMTKYILPELKNKSGAVIRLRNFITTGVPESTLYEQLDNMPEILQNAEVAFLPSLFGVKIRLMAKAADEKTAAGKLARAENLVREKIATEIIADEDVSLEEVIAELLTSRGQTLAVAESCTGGMIANYLTNISGSSKFFERGVVSYSNEAKIQLLNVPQELIVKFGAVSSEVAIAMAEGIRVNAGTDYGIAVTGIAGPTGGTPEKPVGLVYIACADKSGSTFEKHIFIHDRHGNKQRSVQAALNLLRKRILGIPS